MANILSHSKQVQVVKMLAEGSSIRATERVTGVHRDTIMRLNLEVGNGCAVLLDNLMRDLPLKDIQVDEIWGFVRCKQRTARTLRGRAFKGDVWTWVSLDRETKLVPSWWVGKRNMYDNRMFMEDLNSRLSHRVQLSSDCLASYIDAIDRAFGADVDYGQIVKTYHADPDVPPGRYSPGQVIDSTKTAIFGNPDVARICTSHVERNNLTMRMHIRRLTRLTNAFSKKLAGFKAAVALHFAYYNLVRRHASIRMTPAMAAGVTANIWTVEQLVAETTK